MAEFVSPFLELGKLKPIEVRGTMGCSTCYENVSVGLYDPQAKTLVYVCDAGHSNTVENYEL